MTAAAAAYHDSLQRNYINNKTPRCAIGTFFFLFYFYSTQKRIKRARGGKY
jgi:hypothetical protein